MRRQPSWSVSSSSESQANTSCVLTCCWKPILSRRLQAVAKDVPAAELERAKKAAISSVLMNLESRAVVAEDIGRQVLTYGHRCAACAFVTQASGGRHARQVSLAHLGCLGGMCTLALT